MPIDDAVVDLDADVDARGTVRAVQLLRDPGGGFGRMARKCILFDATFDPARDEKGTAIESIARVRVRFSR